MYFSRLVPALAIANQIHFECRVSLYLDPQIRDWVLFPITIVMVRGHVHY